ncbi:putative bifunctional diguanylate cyclase/phosphodiesterase [Hylemonella sp. W303a]|uniref:putative bifunctional diguanylate cyclase/phosphodiesterase n=1 Tax=Hylemonella sp. W303a TaxID=3389873 RepID=UPI00396B346E
MNNARERTSLNASAQRIRIEWILAGLLVLLSVLLCAFSVLSERNLVRSLASERLMGQTLAIEGGLLRRMQGARATLFQIREAWQASDRGASMALLTAFRSLVHGVQRAVIIDREGTVLLSAGLYSSPWVAEVDYLQGLADMRDSDRVYTRALPDSLIGGATLRLTLPILDTWGQARQFVLAELSADYFNMLQRMVLETDDTWSSLSMADGTLLGLLASDPQSAQVAAIWRLDGIGSALGSGPAPGVHILDPAGQPRRLLVRRTVGSSELMLDQPLVLTLSRELRPVDAAWHRLATVYAITLVVLVVAGCGMLRLAQIRRARWEGLVHAQDHERVENVQRMELALEGAVLGLWELSIPDDRMRVDARAAAIQGYQLGELDTRWHDWREDLHPDDAGLFLQQFAQHLEGHTSKFEAECRLRRKDGGWVWVQCQGRVIERDATGQALHFLGTRMDISARKQHETEIERLAFYDSLTGLPNRRLLHERLDRGLIASEERGQVGAIVLIDLDNFKSLNDTLGHDLGDQLLVSVSARLRQIVRVHDTVARLGGDEFVLLLESLGSSMAEARRNAETLGRDLLQRLSYPYHLAGRQIYSTPSLGITLYAGGASKLDDLLKQADMAMYEAKAQGRNTLSFFEPKMQVQTSANAQLQSDLHRALERCELLLHYQPILDRDRRIIGVESLVRWQHPEAGMVSPARFIPVAEQCGLILPLGDWVLEQTCRQLVSWAAHPSTADLFAAVNISARQLSQPDFVVKVLETVRRTGAAPSRLKLELTESMFLLDVEGVIEKMSALKSQGIGFSLDDFGTGYSSLCYLQRLPLDRLKIDKSFVSDLPHNANSATIGSAIIGLAHNLGLQVIAEGVENQGQLQFLLEGQCDAFQGYFFSPPLPVEELERRLSSGSDQIALDALA